MSGPSTRLDEARTLYARMMAAASGSADPRLERIFELVPREAFLPPGPWHIMVEHRLVETPSADPALLYQNALVVLDRQKGINNGEPFLHAGWIGAVAPGAGETVTQVGAGGGYYTAILSMLVLPGGKVDGLRDRRGAGQGRAAKPCAIRKCDRRLQGRRRRQSCRDPTSSTSMQASSHRRAMAAGAEAWRPAGVPVAAGQQHRACRARHPAAQRICAARIGRRLVHPMLRRVRRSDHREAASLGNG